MTVPKQRSVMILFSGDDDIYSHRIRIELAIKAVTVDIVSVDLKRPTEDFIELSPYHTLPTLIDRELTLYETNIIMEYLDERFPHPPLLPVYPVARAKCRLMIHRIEEDWYYQMRLIESGTKKQAAEARERLSDALTKLAPVFGEMPYFMSNDFSLIDCCVAPLLWRLPVLDIKLPSRAKAVLKYADRMFEMSAFQVSLTDVEREMRE